MKTHHILQSRDKRITIEVNTKSLLESVFPQADFSFTNLPLDEKTTSRLFKKLYSAQKNNHCCLIYVHHPRKTRIQAMSNAIHIEKAGFKFHDFIHLTYDNPYKSIQKNLTPLGELGLLFTKSYDVNKNESRWFREEEGTGDCSNVWDLSVAKGEITNKKATCSRHFCLELGYIMASLSSPLICRKFLVIGAPEKAHTEFALKRNLDMYGITSDLALAKRVIRYYNTTISKKGTE